VNRSLFAGVGAAALVVASAGAAAQVERDPQDPNIGGNLNKCWGEVAAAIAQLDVPEQGTVYVNFAGETFVFDGNGGAMGLHSRDPNGQGTTFFDSFPNTDNRAGIGNATGNEAGPHHVEPGDGGLGEHAINNGTSSTGLGLSNFIDPSTGGFIVEPVELTCSLDDGSLIRNDNGDLVIP
jgi:hypothetical protein